MGARHKRLLGRMREAGLDSYIVFSRANTRYLSSFTGSSSILLVHESACVLFTDCRYMLQAKAQIPWEFELVETEKQTLMQSLNERLQRLGCKKTGFEEACVSYRDYLSLTALEVGLEPASSLLEELRLVKDHFELCALRLAQRAADAAFGQLLSLLRPGMSEQDTALDLEYLIKKNGAQATAFDIIVASGENGALPHAMPTQRRFAPGDMIVLDFGGRVNGYCSDMTRTVAVGEPPKELRKAYGVVLDAQLRALDALRPGILGWQLDALARETIEKAGYGDCFGHGLGHGFGLDIHEAPTANRHSQEALQPGMTITVEPGIYLPELGGVRIEDCCVITQTGHENLTSSPKQLLIIE